MTNRASMGHVYDQLKQEGYIDDESPAGYVFHDDDNNSPWFIQSLMGCGGWIAALFMLGVVGACMGTFLINFDENSISMFLLFVGGVFTVGTMLASNDTKLGVFRSQLLLSIHIAGHLLILAGLMLMLDFSGSGLVMALIIFIILQMVFIVLYPNGIYRFLAMLAIAASLNSIAFEYNLPILVSITVAGLMLIALLIWTERLPIHWQIKHFSLLQAIAYGAIVGAFGTMIYEVSNRYYAELPDNTVIITTVLLFICLIWLEGQLMQENKIPLTSPFALTIFGISLLVTIPIITTPGILAAIVAILLAFRRRNRVLLGLAYLYLAGFIIHYYYWLDVTLLTKSIILMVTGLLLIFGRLLLRRIVIVPDEKGGLNS